MKNNILKINPNRRPLFGIYIFRGGKFKKIIWYLLFKPKFMTIFEPGLLDNLKLDTRYELKKDRNSLRWSFYETNEYR